MNREFLSDALGGIADRHISEAAESRPRRPFRLRRAAVIVLAAALCLMLALPVMASADGSYELLYAVAPALAQRLKPVQLSCEDNGIQMEVVAASVQGDTAEAYIALRDLTGDRVDGTTDLFDSWSFHTPFDSANTCTPESYDASTHTATFYVLMTAADGADIRPEDGKITFSVREFLSHKQALEGVDLSAVVSAMPSAPETQTDMQLRGGGLGNGFSETLIPCLVPADEPLLIPADGAAVTGAGYVDGRLHIQVYYEDILRTDNHGFVYYVGEDGEPVYSTLSLSLWDDTQTGSYQEYIFDLPAEALDSVAFYGDFTTCGSLTEGNWQVTFPLSESN